MTQKERALELIKQARDAWGSGDDNKSLEYLNDAIETLVLGGQSQETMPGIFGYIHFIRDRLIANGAGA